MVYCPKCHNLMKTVYVRVERTKWRRIGYFCLTDKCGVFLESTEKISRFSKGLWEQRIKHQADLLGFQLISKRA